MTGSLGGLTSVKRELKELQLLLEISQILDRSMDLREVVGPVLEALANHMEMVRGTLALVNRETGDISIDAAHGLSESQKEKGRYRPKRQVLLARATSVRDRMNGRLRSAQVVVKDV